MSSHVLSRLLISRLLISRHVLSCHVLSCCVMSCHVMSCHVMSHLVMSCHVMSCLVMSCHVTSCHVMSCHVISRLLTSCHALSYHVMSRLVMSCHVMSSHVFSRLVISCHVMSRLVMSCHLARESCPRIFLPSLLNSSIMAAGWPRRGFRNRGPVRESGLERRSRCGAACTASVRVWCRAHFCRVRVAGCGDRACWRRAASMPRVCRGAVPWGLCSGRVLYMHGQRAFRVAGCGDRACWEVCRGHAAGVSAAPCRGDWVRGVSRARMILHAVTCVSRGTSDALMRSGRHWTVDPRGRRNESCTVAKIAGFRGPVRQIACAGARLALRNRGRRRESVDLWM